jgi:di/tricarboxylate transporter
MIPVGEALKTSGGAKWIADTILQNGSNLSIPFLLAIIMAATMFLSDLVNNAAAVIFLAPSASFSLALRGDC